jgi:hypothetical protein
MLLAEQLLLVKEQLLQPGDGGGGKNTNTITKSG